MFRRRERPETFLRLAVLSLCLALQGCTQWYYDLGAALPEAYEAQAEGLTLAEVLRDLGPPLRYTVTPSGLAMAWEAWRISETSVGVSLGFLGADALQADWGDARIEGDFLVVTFDDERRVSAAFRAQRNGVIGGGAALQPVASFVSVVDVDDLLLPLPAHGWGASQLLEPAEALNNTQRPGMGDSALEQRGTPAGAGQQVQGWSQ
jgi:hypothetical protein